MKCPRDGYAMLHGRCPMCGHHQVTRCESCNRTQIHGACPECNPQGFLEALFTLDVQPMHFVSPAHYGAWKRRTPLVVEGARPKVNGRWKRIMLDKLGHHCWHCDSTGMLDFGHLAPWCCGGTDHPGNGVPECNPCNVRQYAPLAAYLKLRAAA